ncbi:zinc-ribbon domain-containing protein [Kocuria arenosa]|uniref:zinc-ribbon domain-containing protein n=1 Tax=Kocuria arenosa TaxID=3071446 RepID=UPI0034D4559B
MGDSELAAERRWRKLHHRGRASAALLAEVLFILSRAGTAQHGATTPESVLRHAFVTVVRLMDLLTAKSLHRDVLDPTTTYAAAYIRLECAITEFLGLDHRNLVPPVWSLMRYSAYRVRRALEAPEVTPVGENLLGVDVQHVLIGRRLRYPLEPFSRYLDALPGGGDTLWGRFPVVTVVPGQRQHRQLEPPWGSAETIVCLCRSGHEYRSSLNALSGAVANGREGCPYCSGRAALAGFNSMAQTHPHLVGEWHPHRNGDIRPDDITGAGNSRKYWWTCKHGHEWPASPNNRAKGEGCPDCAGRRVAVGFNDLATTHPEIAREWDYAANHPLTPQGVTAGQGVRVHWICPSVHPYQATLDARTNRGRGCPTCANLNVRAGYNDLATTHPHLAREWDHRRNAPLTPQQVVAGSHQEVWWLCPLDHSYSSALGSRAEGKGCRYCANQALLTGYNDLATVSPSLAAEWDATRNDGLDPAGVLAAGATKWHWICPQGHPFEQAMSKRLDGQGCPHCANRKVAPGYNDLATREPALAAEWHLTKNGDLTPSDVLPGNTKRWWLCPAGHETLGTVPNRRTTHGCPKCPPAERALNKTTDPPE